MRSSRFPLSFFIIPAILMAAPAGILSPASAAAEGSYARTRPSTAEESASQLRSARIAVAASPDDVEAHLHLGELLHKGGRDQEASEEFWKAACLKPELYVAYHQLSQCCKDKELLEKAIAKLNEVKEKHSNDLMLRVALSELYEKTKAYYPAAKTLIEIQFDNAVPVKYRTRVEARIHYLLTRAHEAQIKEDAPAVATDEELDVVPAPLPQYNLRKGLTASKIKDTRELKGMGHVPLLP